MAWPDLYHDLRLRPDLPSLSAPGWHCCCRCRQALPHALWATATARIAWRPLATAARPTVLQSPAASGRQAPSVATQPLSRISARAVVIARSNRCNERCPASRSAFMVVSLSPVLLLLRWRTSLLMLAATSTRWRRSPNYLLPFRIASCTAPGSSDASAAGTSLVPPPAGQAVPDLPHFQFPSKRLRRVARRAHLL